MHSFEMSSILVLYLISLFPLTLNRCIGPNPELCSELDLDEQLDRLSEIVNRLEKLVESPSIDPGKKPGVPNNCDLRTGFSLDDESIRSLTQELALSFPDGTLVGKTVSIKGSGVRSQPWASIELRIRSTPTLDTPLIVQQRWANDHRGPITLFNTAEGTGPTYGAEEVIPEVFPPRGVPFKLDIFVGDDYFDISIDEKFVKKFSRPSFSSRFPNSDIGILYLWNIKLIDVAVSQEE